MSRSLNRATRWAALLALVLATLAPGIAHALRHARGDTLPWSELCSATGGKRVLFDSQTGVPGSPPHAHAFEQCTLCALHLGSWAPPPVAATHALRSDLRTTAPVVPPVLQQPRLAWLAAQPRAPPPHV
jgi:hypothetical protein